MISGEKVNMALKILVCNNRRDSSKMNQENLDGKKKREDSWIFFRIYKDKDCEDLFL